MTLRSLGIEQNEKKKQNKKNDKLCARANNKFKIDSQDDFICKIYWEETKLILYSIDRENLLPRNDIKFILWIEVS